MKKRLTILLLFWASVIQAQQITTVEYYYDTDPGFGNGTMVTLNSTSLDSTFNFAVPTLPAGLHTFYVRLKDSNNKWSTVYQNNILIINGAAGIPQIIKAEYFYDTDPGLGNGNSISLNNANLDSTLNFSTNGLPPGAHSLFIRLQNSATNWSTTYQNNFLVWPGSSGSPQIQTLLYFIDSVSNTVQAPLNLSATLDTTVSIHIPDNGTDLRKLGLQLRNQTGQLGNATLADISLCSLYAPVSGFNKSQFGNTFTFYDASTYNPSKRVRWKVDGILFDSSRLINYTIPDGFFGNKIIEEITGTGCRLDAIQGTIVFSGLEKYASNDAVIGNDFVMELYGGGLSQNMNVYLKRGDTVYTAYAKYPFNGNKQMTCYFDFHGRTPIFPFTSTELYDLHVVFTGGHEEIRVGGIRLRNPTACEFAGGPRPINCGSDADPEPYFTVTKAGRADFRTGSWLQQSLEITNRSSAPGYHVTVWLLVPDDYDLVFNGEFHKYNAAQIDSLQMLPYTIIDTFLNGHHYQKKLYGFLVPIIEGGETRIISYKIRSSVPGKDSCYYWVNKRMFGSPMKPFWSNCQEDVFNFIIGFAPVAGCLNAAYDFTYSNVTTGGYQTAGNFAYSLGNLALNCVPAEKVGMALSKIKEIQDGISGATTVIQHTVGNTALGLANGNPFVSCDPKNVGKPVIDPMTGVISYDPNYLSGNSQHDSVNHFINNYSPQNYSIGFENISTATAPAQHVWVTDTFNIAKFYYLGFTITGFTIGDSAYRLTAFRNTITKDVWLKSRNDLKVRFTGVFDTARGIMRCDFHTIDTSGKLWDESSADGFLPPDMDGITGTGTVFLSIPAKNLNTLDTFKNVAHIYFDNNPPITTNQWINTVDTTAPTGSILNSIRINDTTVKLVVHHDDIGSGFSYNEFYLKGASDTVFRNIGTSLADSVLFTGLLNQSYQLYSVAVDNVGNVQPKTTSDITVSFSNPLPLTWLSFTGKLINDKVQLKWLTANELNTSRFDIEKSTDGNNFSKIGTTPAKGNTGHNNEYIAYDDHPAAGNNYYRLKQFDIDGRFTKSNIVRVYYGKAGYVMIAPNPASDHVTISGSTRFDQILLIDAAGAVVRIFKTVAGDNYSLNGISAGPYYLKLINSNETQIFKLQIQ